VGTGLVMALVSGLWPARRAWRRRLVTGVRGVGGGSGTPLPARLSRSILASEVAVATVIMVGALFLSVGIWRFLNQPLGFDATDRYSITWSENRAMPDAVTDWPQLLDGLSRLPGVRSAAVRDAGPGPEIAFPDVAALGLDVEVGTVSDRFFEAWGIRPFAGRLFGREELGADVAVVDARFAERVWPGQQAIGRTFRTADDRVREVVGSSSRCSSGCDGIRRDWRTCRAATCLRRSASCSGPRACRSTRSPSVSRPSCPRWRRACGRASTPKRSTRCSRVMPAKPVSFLAAAIGLYGLVSYLVARRTREYGIRIALGASRRALWLAVIRESLLPAVAGTAIGLVAAALLQRWLTANVFGYEASSLAAMSVVAAALLLVAVLAAAGPARRVLRIDPTVALRSE
jgi:putative ABC transport system permease protein